MTEDQTPQSLYCSEVEENDFAMFLDNYPHIHLHSYAEDMTAAEDELGFSEICCHGCEESIFITFNLPILEIYPEGPPLMLQIRNTFVGRHVFCGDSNTAKYMTRCPNKRRNVKNIDLTLLLKREDLLDPGF